MGNCNGTQDTDLSAIEASVFRSVHRSPDWDALSELFTVQFFASGASSTYVKILPTHSFYLVLKGKVLAYLANEKGQQTSLCTYGPGDIIYLPPGFKSSRGTLSCGSFKLFFQMQTLDDPVRMISAERHNVDTFLAARPQLEDLAYLFSSRSTIVKDVAQSAICSSLSVDQIHLLLSAMKMTSFDANQLIYKPQATMRERPLFVEQSVGIVLKGSIEASPRHPSVKHHSAATPDLLKGVSFFGLDHCFVHKNPDQSVAFVGRTPGLLCHISTALVQHVFHRDLTLKRVLRRDYYFDLLHSQRARFPLLAQLEEGQLRALCKKIRLRGLVPAPAQYMPAQSCFLVLHGLIHVEDRLLHRRVSYAAGTTIAASSLATNDTEGASVKRKIYIQAQQPTLVACITSGALSDAFGTYKLELSLLLLRLGRQQTSLAHLLYLPAACKHIQTFVHKAVDTYSEQDLVFYIAVQRFEDLCLGLQLYASRSLPPRDWRRIMERYAAKDVVASDCTAPRPKTFQLSLYPGDRHGSFSSASGALQASPVSTSGRVKLLRSQGSSKFCLTPSLSMKLLPPSRQASSAGLSPQSSVRSLHRVDSNHSNPDEPIEEATLRPAPVPALQGPPLFLMHPAGDDQGEDAGPEPEADHRPDGSIATYIPLEEAIEAIEAQMQEVRSVVQLLLESFLHPDRPTVLNIGHACAEDAQQMAQTFIRQPLGLSLGLFFMGLISKYAAGGAGASSTSAASIGAQLSVVEVEGGLLNEEKRKMMALLQTISAKSQGSRDAPLIGAEMIFAGAKQEIYATLRDEVHSRWRDSEDFELFLRDALPPGDELHLEGGVELPAAAVEGTTQQAGPLQSPSRFGWLRVGAAPVGP